MADVLWVVPGPLVVIGRIVFLVLALIGATVVCEYVARKWKGPRRG